jgi:DNA-binding transcriptional regulator GbsR (MarR family)
MPGGRLTQPERQQIALGLADGLAYAEIARRLDRPTSTITREVMRNGGPTGYRADLAHRATERRAQRRRQAAPRGPAAATAAYGRDTEAVREFEESFATVMMASGMPKMMARVMACLTLTDSGSLTASDLVQRLQVSPASVSKAITYLEGQAFVRRERDERRRERYVVDDDIWYQSMLASARALNQVIEIARQGVGVLGRETPAAARLENVARFLDFVSESTIRAAEQARAVLHTKPGSGGSGEAEGARAGSGKADTGDPGSAAGSGETNGTGPDSTGPDSRGPDSRGPDSTGPESGARSGETDGMQAGGAGATVTQAGGTAATGTDAGA